MYVEGGATGKTADSDFRRGWKKFLYELHELAREHGYHALEVVRGKGRGNAYQRFTKHEKEHPTDLCVLLVDSEMAVPNNSRVWDIVACREGDKWQRPAWATERHLYLMVHFVETWLLTDQNALQQFFKGGFNLKVLPTTNLESRSKAEITGALKKATQDSSKGPYQHGQAHEIIEIVAPDRVKTLTHGQRLFDCLGSLIKGEPET
ncbi:MAG: DUF4276 family protein [Acidobacteria bacterium]|nr:DUF4276 family protein [Acidobacteriota bacterium]